MSKILSRDGRFTTGCLLLDLAVGGGEGLGIPYGKIINIVGDKSAGKTFLSNEILASNYHRLKKDFEWNLDDGESGYTFNTQHLYGVDLKPDDAELIYTSKTVEELDVNVSKFFKKKMNKKGKKGIYVLDSLDGLSNEDTEKRAEDRYKQAESGKEIKEKGTFGMKTPKFLSSEFFKTKTAKFDETDAMFVVVSQVRDNIDPMSMKKQTRSGGKALDFYCHSVLWLAGVTKISVVVEGEKKTIGGVVKARLDKSKTPRPFREVMYSFYHDYGIDDIGSSIDYLFGCRGDSGKLLASANSICWDGEPKTLEAVKLWLEAEGLIEEAKEAHKVEFGRSNLKLEYIDEWIKTIPEKEKLYNRKFGTPLKRADLIAKIEENPKLKEELDNRVIEKWERIESEALKEVAGRKRKYG